MPEVRMYATEFCGYCSAARMLFKKKGVNYEEILVSRDAGKREEMERLSGRRTVPQIFIDGQPIGGFDELYALDTSGELDKLLGGPADADSH
jgi:glutaredoxin 3